MSRFSVKKPYTVIVGIVLVIILGFVSLSKMSTDLLPSMNMPYALVITSYAGASPEQVESVVTEPIESAMASTSNIKNISSSSSNNLSMVILEFEQTANMDSVTIEMRESLDQIKGYWPDAVGNPIIMKINPDMMPIMIAAVDVDGMDTLEISDYTNDELIAELESVEGVASVSATGVVEESIHVVLNQEKIDAINEKIMASLDEKFSDAENQMNSAKSEIESGKDKLESGQDEMAGQLGDAQNQLNDKKIELFQTEADLNVKLAELQETKSTTEAGIASLQEVQSQVQTLIENKSQLIAAITGMQQVGQDTTEMEANLAQIEAGLSMVKAQLAAQEGSTVSEASSDEELTAYLTFALTQAQQGLVQINGGIATIQTALENIAAGKTTINETLATLNESQIAGVIEMGSASAQLASGEQKLEESKKEFEDTKQQAYDSADLNHILTMDTLSGILTAQNFSMPAGYITEDGIQYMVRVGDAVDSVDALKDMVLMDLGMEGVDTIHLSDVADITVVDDSADSYAKVNGNPGIMLSIEKQTGYSTGDVTDRVYDKLETMQKKNENLHVSVLMDQGVYIDMIVDSVLNNIIYGAILAVIILVLFLKDIKPTLVIAVSIPISVIFAIVLMYFSGVTLNMISLSGLALGIGMLVDNSIVVIENIYRMRSEGISARKAAVEGAKQVSGAIAASTLTTVCVFAPIVFTEGITRQLFVDMGLTIAYALLASLIVALTFVPMMGSKMLKKTKEIKHPWFEKFQNVYGVVLEKLLHVKPLVLLAMVGLLVVSAYASASKGTAFFPDMESTQMTVTITPPEEFEFEETCELADKVTEKIQEIEDVESIGAMAGGGTMMSMGSGNEQVTLYLILKEDKEHSNEEIAAMVTDMTKDMEGEVTANASSMDMTALMGEGLSIQIKGRDLDTLQDTAKEVSEIVKNVKGTTEVSDGVEETTPEFRIIVDKEKAAKYGMTVAQVYQLVYAQMEDSTADATISTDIKDYDVYLESVEQSTASIDSIKNLTFSYTDKETGDESEIPLSEVATFEETEGLSAIRRDGQERYINVTATIAEGYNVGLVGNEVEKALSKYECPEGYSIEMEGEDEMINEAMEQLLLMLVLAIAFIYLIMVAQFQSLKAPFIILFTIPLALTGGFLALFFTNNEISIIAMIGFIMLVGVIVNNGIVMVDYINQLRREGIEKKEAIVTAGKTRLRPILMTAMTTILAMSTTAFGHDMGSDMSRPMAIVTIGGMMYGTLMTLIVVPCIYDLFYSNKSMVEEEI